MIKAVKLCGFTLGEDFKAILCRVLVLDDNVVFQAVAACLVLACQKHDWKCALYDKHLAVVVAEVDAVVGRLQERVHLRVLFGCFRVAVEDALGDKPMVAQHNELAQKFFAVTEGAGGDTGASREREELF